MARSNSKKNIIESIALEMMYENGYNNTTLRQIAEECGVSHVAVIRHFGSKEALAAILIERYLEFLIGMTKDYLSGISASDKDPTDAMLYYWSAHYEFLIRDTHFKRFYDEFYAANSEYFINIHNKYTGYVVKDLMHIYYKKNDLYFQLDSKLLAYAGMELNTVCGTENFNLIHTVAYLVNVFAKIFDYPEKMSFRKISAFINKNILTEKYIRYDLGESIVRK